MSFDRISKRFEKPKPVALEPPAEGDPCSNPKCGGKMTRGYIVTWRSRETGATGQGTYPSPLAKLEEFCAEHNQEHPTIHYLPGATDRFLCELCGWTHGVSSRRCP